MREVGARLPRVGLVVAVCFVALGWLGAAAALPTVPGPTLDIVGDLAPHAPGLPLSPEVPLDPPLDPEDAVGDLLRRAERAVAEVAPRSEGMGRPYSEPDRHPEVVLGPHGGTPAPTGPSSSLTGTAAGVSLAALLAGIFAYYWPVGKYAFTALYTRIPRDTVLAHDTRERIYKLVKDQPGIHANDVCDRLGLGWGTAVHHLHILEQHGLLMSHRDGRYRRFFLVGDDRAAQRQAVGVLRHPTSRRVAELVAERPGLIQKQVCESLGLSTSLVAWHLGRLKAAGIVAAQRQGRTVQYRPGPAWSGLEGVGEDA